MQGARKKLERIFILLNGFKGSLSLGRYDESWRIVLPF